MSQKNSRPTNTFRAQKTQPITCVKCAHHNRSPYYVSQVAKHNNIFYQSTRIAENMNSNHSIDIKVALHFLAPVGTYDPDRVFARAQEVMTSVNDDFNNYSANRNTMNNFRYKNVVNRVFLDNAPKQNVYLSNRYLSYLPTQPANITFELDNVYYYPVRNRLNLARYDDVEDVELEYQAIRQYIHNNRADAIDPEHFLNIWVIDMTDTSILGFANFPWETQDGYHGVVINRRVFFPEEYGETNFNQFKTLTHEIGHYLGLMHVFDQDTSNTATTRVSSNLHLDIPEPEPKRTFPNRFKKETKVSLPVQTSATYNPLDRVANSRLHTDSNYNPLFMNFMDYTYDQYVNIFTQDQIQQMRYMIATYRPNINYNSHHLSLPVSKYNPRTNTMLTTLDTGLTSRFNVVNQANVTNTTLTTRQMPAIRRDTAAECRKEFCKIINECGKKRERDDEVIDECESDLDDDIDEEEDINDDEEEDIDDNEDDVDDDDDDDAEDIEDNDDTEEDNIDDNEGEVLGSDVDEDQGGTANDTSNFDGITTDITNSDIFVDIEGPEQGINTLGTITEDVVETETSSTDNTANTRRARVSPPVKAPVAPKSTLISRVSAKRNANLQAVLRRPQYQQFIDPNRSTKNVSKKEQSKPLSFRRTKPLSALLLQQA